MYTKPILLCVIALTLAGCSRASFETEPQTINTSQGPVVCQLYTQANLNWDRAIERPAAMDEETANNNCRELGKRRKAGEL